MGEDTLVRRKHVMNDIKNVKKQHHNTCMTSQIVSILSYSSHQNVLNSSLSKQDGPLTESSTRKIISENLDEKSCRLHFKCFGVFVYKQHMHY